MNIPTDIVITVAHKGGNTCRGSLDTILEAYLVKGWTLESVEHPAWNLTQAELVDKIAEAIDPDSFQLVRRYRTLSPSMPEAAHTALLRTPREAAQRVIEAIL